MCPALSGLSLHGTAQSVKVGSSSRVGIRSPKHSPNHELNRNLQHLIPFTSSRPATVGMDGSMAKMPPIGFSNLTLSSSFRLMHTSAHAHFAAWSPKPVLQVHCNSELCSYVSRAHECSCFYRHHEHTSLSNRWYPPPSSMEEVHTRYITLKHPLTSPMQETWLAQN